MISIKTENGIKIITLERSDKSNAINKSLLDELNSAFKNKSQNEVQCIILTGSGEKVFCAGADLEERQGMSQAEIIRFLDKFRETLKLIEEQEFPVIALMNGSAFGGGLELALACDIRLGREDSLIGLTETKLGIIPGAGGTQRLSRLIGISKAKDLIYRAVRITGIEAFEYGILNKAFSHDSFKDESNKYIEQIVTSAPLALKCSKLAIEAGYDLLLEDGLDVERREYLKTLETKDRVEALNAFKEKRKPIFKGE